MSKSKIIIGAAVVAIGLGVAFKCTIQTHMYAFMHSSMHDGVVRQSLTGIKAPRSHKSMKRRFETTQ